MEITLKDLKELLCANNSAAEEKSPFINEYVIVRCYSSGVHFGKLLNKNGRNAHLVESRRIYYTGAF